MKKLAYLILLGALGCIVVSERGYSNEKTHVQRLKALSNSDFAKVPDDSARTSVNLIVNWPLSDATDEQFWALVQSWLWNDRSRMILACWSLPDSDSRILAIQLLFLSDPNQFISRDIKGLKEAANRFKSEEANLRRNELRLAVNMLPAVTKALLETKADLLSEKRIRELNLLVLEFDRYIAKLNARLEAQ